MVERILQLISQTGISTYAFEKQLGFAMGTISNWRNGKSKPSSDAIMKFARYFNLSADYLLCLTDNPTPLEQTDDTPLSLDLALLSQDKDFVNSAKLYKAMSKKCKDKVNAFILGVATGSGLNVEEIIGEK